MVPLSSPGFRIFLLAIFLSSSTCLFSQKTIEKDSLSQLQAEKPIDIGYGFLKQKEMTAAISSLEAADFNQGLISDPLLLAQGKLAGIQIYNRGGNPNRSSLIRMRGLSGFTHRYPLVVVDGIAGASLDNLDPNDIASIDFLRDGSSQAIYGIRASNGVLLVRTKDGSTAKDGLTVSYTGQAAVSSTKFTNRTHEP